MTQATIFKKLNKTAEEVRDLIKESKRKLLELEVMMNLSDIRRGKAEKFKSANALLRGLK
ncbi:MAG: hypothetical protein Q8P76_00755 [bacterium]|nr:hypothetical protein [bacterium]